LTATVFYDSVNEIAVLSNTFTNSAGSIADPTTISCVITDPSGTSITHTYAGAAPADIVKVSTGKYSLAVACSPAEAGVDGLWGFEWVGTGVVSDVQPGTWRVLPASVSQLWYVGMEEMKDRLGISDTSEDYALQTAIATASGWINQYCGRHFNRVTEARTYQPHDIWLLEVDDIVPGATIAVAVDQDGDGVFEEPWTQGVDYQLRLGDGLYNPNATGVTRPYRQIQVIGSGKWFPFTWPYATLDRVQVSTTWGWTAVPWEVAEACRILAADVFKMKDAPFGVAGVSDLGTVRVQSNPWLVENLRAYVNGTRKVGI
jgi:Phage gp6-like head-tail connector protein